MKKETYEKGNLPNMACEFTPELKARLERFDKERQELHIPALPHVFITTKTEKVEFDPDSELNSDFHANMGIKKEALLQERYYKANSFTRYVENYLAYVICGQNNDWSLSYGGYNLGKYAKFIARQTTSTSSYLYNYGDYPRLEIASFTRDSWASTAKPTDKNNLPEGIVIGYTEGAQEYYNRFSMDNVILHSANATTGRVFYFNPESYNFTLSPSDNTWTRKVTRKFLNNSASVISVNEVGIFGTIQVLMEYSVLPDVITLEPGVMLTVTYEFKYVESVPDDGLGQEPVLDAAGIYFDFDTLYAKRVGISKNWLPGEDFDQLSIYGDRRKCMMALSGEIIKYEDEEGYDENGTGTSALTSTELVGKNGTIFPAGTIFNIMIEHPKFYYRVIPTRTTSKNNGSYYSIDAGYFYISNQQKEGFRIHPAFLVDGVEKDKIYSGAYPGRLIDGKLRFLKEFNRSTSSINLSTYEARVAANNSAEDAIWRPMNYEFIMAEKLLLAVEYCSFSILGLYINPSDVNLASMERLLDLMSQSSVDFTSFDDKTKFLVASTHSNRLRDALFKYRHSFLLTSSSYISNLKTNSNALMFSSEFPYNSFSDTGIQKLTVGSLISPTKFVISNSNGDCDDAWFLCGLAVGTITRNNVEITPASSGKINWIGYGVTWNAQSLSNSTSYYSPRVGIGEGFIFSSNTRNYVSQICLCIP